MPRERLPNRRAQISFGFKHIAPSGVAYDYAASLGYYADGRLGEVFLSSGRTGTDVDISTRDAAIAMSLALQAGSELGVLAAAFLKRDDNTPDGPLGTLCRIIESDPDLESITPAVAEVQSARPMMEREVVIGEITAPTAVVDRRHEALLRGYAGEACPECKNYTLVRSGTCLKCDTCGATTGCS